MPDLIDILTERGFIKQATNLDGLREAMQAPITFYVGFDLTADSLHVGSLIQIMLIRHLMKAGHKAFTVMGEATTRIGDPTGKNAARPILPQDKIRENMSGIIAVLDKLVGHHQIKNNNEWLNNQTTLFDFLDVVGRHFTVNKMVALDTVKNRLDNNDPMSFLEFTYSLMQATDFLNLHQNHNCILQIGGSDQWGNIIGGVELVRHKTGNEVFGLTTPLMTNTAGEKMGKTASGAIWLDKDKTSPFEFWQFWRNVEDAKVGEFLRLFTELPMDEITRLEALQGEDLNDAKKILATEVTALVHDRATAEQAAILASGGCITASNSVAMPVHLIEGRRFDEGITLAHILTETGLVASKGAADRMAQNKGVRLNGTVIEDVREVLPRSAFENAHFVISVGKAKAVTVRIDE